MPEDSDSTRVVQRSVTYDISMEANRRSFTGAEPDEKGSDAKVDMCAMSLPPHSTLTVFASLETSDLAGFNA